MEYVEQRGGGYYVAGSRVSLDSIVYKFLEGRSPEGIVDSFPTLTLEQVYGAITYYLGHRAEIDAYLKESEAEFEKLAEKMDQQFREANPLLYAKLENARMAHRR